jgi:transcriptional regulator with XRE-family HTH domain
MTPLQARLKKGISQRALAKKARISRGSISMAEKLRQWPVNDLTFAKYAKALGINPIR